MRITYDSLLKRIDSGDVQLMEGVVKSKLGMEYDIRSLVPVTNTVERGAKRWTMPSRVMRYVDGDKETFLGLSDPDIAMEVYLRVLDVSTGKCATKDVYLGDYPSGGISVGLDQFRQRLSAARNALYLRLQEMKRRKDMADYCGAGNGKIVIFESEKSSPLSEPEKIFEVDLYKDLENAAKELFSGQLTPL